MPVVCVCLCVCVQDNFRKVMEVRKKLIGDSGDTLITPYRVSHHCSWQLLQIKAHYVLVLYIFLARKCECHIM